MTLYDVRAKIEFSNPFKPRILHTDDHAKVVLVCLAPGQAIPPHAEDNQAFFNVLEGSGVIVTDEGEVAVTAGNLVSVARGGKRGIRSDGGNLVVLAVAVL